MSSPSNTFKDVKDESRERLSADLEHLKSSFAQLKSDVTHLINTTVGAGKASLHAVRDQAGSSVESAVGEVKGKVNDLTDRSQKQLEQFGELVSERPLTSALVAFGVGFVIAKILSR